MIAVVLKDIWQYAINNEPTNIYSPPPKKANTLHPTTGLCIRLLGFAPDDWAFHPTTGLCKRLLGFHPATGLCIRLLGFNSNTHFLPNPQKPTQFRPTYFHRPFPIESRAVINGILPYTKAMRKPSIERNMDGTVGGVKAGHLGLSRAMNGAHRQKLKAGHKT